MKRLIYGLVYLCDNGEHFGNVAVILESELGLNSNRLKNELINIAIEKHKRCENDNLSGFVVSIQEINDISKWASEIDFI